MTDTLRHVQAADARSGMSSTSGRAIDLAGLVRAVPNQELGHFTIDVPIGVEQGRGAWGGVATGAMTSAATQLAPDSQSVRTMSAQLVAPLLSGRAHIVTEVLRSGSATTTVAARVLSRENEVVAHGVVVLGAARGGEGMPHGPGWSSITPPPELARGPGAWPVAAVRAPAPDFLGQFELRPTVGLPFGGTAGTEASGWLQPLGGVSHVDAALLVALSDTWWIAVMARLDRPRPAATIGFACETPGDPADVRIDAAGRLEPLFHRGRLIAARDGFAVETRELWTADGTLLTWSTQTTVVIK